MTRQSLRKAAQPLVSQSCQCKPSQSSFILPYRPSSKPLRLFSTSTPARAVDLQTVSADGVQAAPEINFDDPTATINRQPARIIPSSPSYFTGSPQFNDSILELRQLIRKYETLPTVQPDQAPRQRWLKLAQYRSRVGEPVSAARYSKVIQLLARLNRIHPNLQPKDVRNTMQVFFRPRPANLLEPVAPTLDKYGRARGMGRRKESSAQVFLVEGDGQVLINGRSLVEVFPRMHDRESALWALKTTDRLNRYNIWATSRGGGVTGQAESITLAAAKALLVHEPALKPILRQGMTLLQFPMNDLLIPSKTAGCITSDSRRVERKKPGRLKARKKPAWVKR